MIRLVKAVNSWATSFLERVGIKCNKCGNFGNTKIVKEKRLEWGTNCGGMLLMDPFYLKIKNRICNNCGHVKISKVVGSEPA